MGREARAGLILLALLIAAALPAAGSQIVEDAAVVIGTIDNGSIEIELSSGERLLLVDLDDTQIEIEVGSFFFLDEESLDAEDQVALIWPQGANDGLLEGGLRLRARLLPARPEFDPLMINDLALDDIEVEVEDSTLDGAEVELEDQGSETRGTAETAVESQILQVFRTPTLGPTPVIEPTATIEPTVTPDATLAPGTPVPTVESTPVSATPVPTLVPACDPSYPDFCIPPPPPDLNCSHFTQKNIRVLPPDPHNLDGNGDGIGCVGPTATGIPSPTAVATATRTPLTVVPTATPTRTPTRTPTLVPTLSADAAAPCLIGQIKGNRNSNIYHMPTGSSYAQTKANVECFNTEAQAVAAGYRRAAN